MRSRAGDIRVFIKKTSQTASEEFFCLSRVFFAKLIASVEGEPI